MKMRHHRIQVQNKVLFGVLDRYWQGRIDELLTPSPEEQAARDAQHRAAMDQLFRDIGLGVFADAPAEQKFICERVKDGEAVSTFDSREEALALLNKHYRQKKAKLQIRNSLTGELEVFSEEEMA